MSRGRQRGKETSAAPAAFDVELAEALPVEAPKAARGDTIAVVRALLEKDLERAETGAGLAGKPLTETQHRVLRNQIVTFLERIGRLTGESMQMPERKIVKLPAFRRAMDDVVRVLGKYPDAAAAVAAELRRIEES